MTSPNSMDRLFRRKSDRFDRVFNYVLLAMVSLVILYCFWRGMK